MEVRVDCSQPREMQSNTGLPFGRRQWKHAGSSTACSASVSWSSATGPASRDSPSRWTHGQGWGGKLQPFLSGEPPAKHNSSIIPRSLSMLEFAILVNWYLSAMMFVSSSHTTLLRSSVGLKLFNNTFPSVRLSSMASQKGPRRRTTL